MPPDKLFDLPGKVLLRKGKCEWCLNKGVYNDGTQCMHGDPPRSCPMHGRWTDINLVARGRRAVVKCTHYGNAFVVLYMDPSADEDEYGTYTIQFGMIGVGSEVYPIPPKLLICPHRVYDTLVREMQAGKRPSHNRIPQPQSQTTTPGEALNGDN